MLNEKCKEGKVLTSRPRSGIVKYIYVYVCVCECNVVNATLSQRYLESAFLSCHNVVITTLSQPKSNVVTTLSQCDIVCWENVFFFFFSILMTINFSNIFVKTHHTKKLALSQYQYTDMKGGKLSKILMTTTCNFLFKR